MIKNLETVLKHYLECMFWTEEEELEKENVSHFNMGVDDIHPSDMAKLREDIESFMEMSKDLLTVEWTDEQVGHDFYLTRNSHGTGFWDRGLPNGDELTKNAQSFGTTSCYVAQIIRMEG